MRFFWLGVVWLGVAGCGFVDLSVGVTVDGGRLDVAGCDLLPASHPRGPGGSGRSLKN